MRRRPRAAEPPTQSQRWHSVLRGRRGCCGRAYRPVFDHATLTHEDGPLPSRKLRTALSHYLRSRGRGRRDGLRPGGRPVARLIRRGCRRRRDFEVTRGAGLARRAGRTATGRISYAAACGAAEGIRATPRSSTSGGNYRLLSDALLGRIARPGALCVAEGRARRQYVGFARSGIFHVRPSSAVEIASADSSRRKTREEAALDRAERMWASARAALGIDELRRPPDVKPS